MAEFTLNGRTKVKTLKANFKVLLSDKTQLVQ